MSKVTRSLTFIVLFLLISVVAISWVFDLQEGFGSENLMIIHIAITVGVAFIVSGVIKGTGRDTVGGSDLLWISIFFLMAITFAVSSPNVFEDNFAYYDADGQFLNRSHFIPLLEHRVIYPEMVQAEVSLPNGDLFILTVRVLNQSKVLFTAYGKNPEAIHDSLHIWLKKAYKDVVSKNPALEPIPQKAVNDSLGIELINALNFMQLPALAYDARSIEIQEFPKDFPIKGIDKSPLTRHLNEF
ncbi:MAG: hypothetical protein WCT08_00090 [Patescibacteria group bacterium]|jgi:hypothetical protein